MIDPGAIPVGIALTMLAQPTLIISREPQLPHAGHVRQGECRANGRHVRRVVEPIGICGRRLGQLQDATVGQERPHLHQRRLLRAGIVKRAQRPKGERFGQERI